MAVGPSQAPMIPMETASFWVKPRDQSEAQGQKDAELTSRTEEKDLRILQERTKIGHGPDAYKNEEGKYLRQDPCIIDDSKKPVRFH